MKTMKNRKIFLLFTLTTIGALLCSSAYAQVENSPFKLHQVTKQISVTGQVTQAQLSQLKDHGIKTVIDLRPDGEGSDQPASDDMAAAAKANGMDFHYIPVHPGTISDESVNKLAKALQETSAPVLIYCRSGSRAARTWSLVEASKQDGMSATDIMAAVKEAGQSADNLSQEIMDRISKRKLTLEKNH